MLPPPPLPPSFFFSLFLSLFMIPTYFSSCHAEGYSYSACAPFSCGNFSDISYPFWNSNQPDYCGHPKFKLDCQQDNLTIDIMSQKFHIIGINQTTQIMKIARLDLWVDPSCSNNFTAFNLDFAFFNYTNKDDYSTLFYDCDPPSYYSYSVTVNNAYPLTSTCSIDGDRYAYLVLSTNLANSFTSLGCKNNTTVPVLKEAELSFIKNAITSDVEYVLNEGFEVGWMGVNKDQCDSCIKSDGRCGHNNASNFICLCPNDEKTYDGGNICGTSPARSPFSAPDLAILSPTQPYSMPYPATNNLWNWKRKLTVGVTAWILGLFICIIVYCFRGKLSTWKINFWMTTKGDQDVEAFLKNHGDQNLKRYKFSDVKKMTNSFKEKLGQGGFGAVYKGKLLTGCPVAVKILNASKKNGADFINEVASISRTSHINVVTLLGFCFEGHKKALIYEFMANGSLEKFIYKNVPETTPSLSSENLNDIAKGIARGLEYLHRGCNTRILHFDIKPHNILLDENFCPKISDFGLAKLCPRKESIISMSDARGTLGYVAPEVWNRNFGGVSHKSDVYSYGMMLLEMVGGRKNINAEASHSSEIYFPDWIYKRLEMNSDLGRDGVVATEDEIAKKMTLVGLWCIQTFPNNRPTISKVIEMLEGNMNSLEVPPKPVLSSPPRSILELSSPTRSVTESSTT